MQFIHKSVDYFEGLAGNKEICGRTDKNRTGFCSKHSTAIVFLKNS
jgi:hypothetical protein